MMNGRFQAGGVPSKSSTVGKTTRVFLLSTKQHGEKRLEKEQTSIRCIAVRETSVSRHNEGSK